MYYVLLYDYVKDAVEKRAPHREEHLRLAAEALKKGELILGGALADPVDSAILVFECDDKSVVEAFVGSDPYVKNGIVTAWRVRPWTVVVGPKD